MDPYLPAGIITALIQDDKKSNFRWSCRLEVRGAINNKRIYKCNISPLKTFFNKWHLYNGLSWGNCLNNQSLICHLYNKGKKTYCKIVNILLCLNHFNVNVHPFLRLRKSFLGDPGLGPNTNTMMQPATIFIIMTPLISMSIITMSRTKWLSRRK